MHYLTIIGVILIFAGTILTYYGQQIKSDESNKSLINTINSKDQKIDSLSNEIAQLKTQEDIRNDNRKAKIKTIAQRANCIFSESDLFYQEFISKYCDPELSKLLQRDKTESVLTKDEIIKRVTEAFTSTTMLNDSIVKRSDGSAISELEYFYMQMTKVYLESNSILEHYGDVDHVLIKQIDEIRNKSKMFVEMLPLLRSVEGGVAGVFGEKVPDQWADFFTHFYYIQHNCQRTCRTIMEEY